MTLWQRIIAFGFRLLYNEFAFTYDIVSKVVSMGAWRCWQRTALKHLNVRTGARVLELAHGTGDLQLDLHAHGFLPVGYDLSSYMGRIASRKLKRHRITPRLIRGHVESLPFQAESYDTIVCTFPTNFIASSRTLAECYRVLCPKGRMIVVLSGVFTSRGIPTRLLEFAYRVTGQRESSTPQTELNAEAYVALLTRFADAGFAARIHFEDCPRSSKAILIIAEKP